MVSTNQSGLCTDNKCCSVAKFESAHGGLWRYVEQCTLNNGIFGHEWVDQHILILGEPYIFISYTLNASSESTQIWCQQTLNAHFAIATKPAFSK